MKKPIKPVKPKAPEQFITTTNTVVFTVMHKGDTLAQFLDEYFPGIPLNDLIIKEDKVYGFGEANYWWENGYGLSHTVVEENPNYLTQLNLYNKKYAEFAEKIKKYEEELKLYKADRIAKLESELEVLKGG